MTIRIKKLLDTMPKLNNPIMVEGLPGIGNVGKVVVDFLVDELKAKKVCEIRSFGFPNSVFVDENSMIEMPTVALYYKKFNGKGSKRSRQKRDIILLAGDVQPFEEEASYEFSYKILEMMDDFRSKELITIGGIGLNAVPENPKVYCTGNSKDVINRYTKDVDVSKNLYGVVGPIIGATGLLVGLAKEKDIDAVCFLAETYNHPLYLGMKGSQKILEVLNKKLDLGLKLRDFGKEIEEVEKELMRRTKDLENVSKKAKMSKFQKDEASYIG